MKQRKYLMYVTMGGMVAAYLFVATCNGEKMQQETQQTSAGANLATLSEADQRLIQQSRSIFGALPASAEVETNPLNATKVELGKMLFHDARLSKSSFISCNSCHNLASYGVDNLPTSVGHNWQLGNRNAPTVLNAAFHMAQFWDGRAADVEEQAKMPILNEVEMALPHEEVGTGKIASIPEYQKLFAIAFPGEEIPLTYDNIGKAIAAFERTLITPSRFDRYLEGDADALTPQEKRGLEAFLTANCQTCHMTPLFGGHIYQKFGVMKDYWELTGSKAIDRGRADVTKNENESYVFKVPSLRNITRTYPYFHDGSIWDLKQAVAIMNELQFGKKLGDQEIDDIVVFLGSLTGDIPESARLLPILPPSSGTTGLPDFQ
ncbi:cytochrome c peroxidase [Parapedobacter koreensis]|uniref:Cytochrome c peroxidase n=2 Tax=Parapedobacter koreensis TaxID=332977 RepID=A0A1H7PGJ9_9SPHI|nr:cytochrome c peroxidase [Parapedobacter koreensis]